MNRSLKLSILVALTLSSAQALALGLGQIRVKSALNKPLVAEIPLRVDHPGEADQIQVSLASSDQFARAGLDRMSLTVQLKFKVTTNANGQKVIEITSDEPVRESFLDFLVKVDWPRGQLLREYTVLLDPPSMSYASRTQGAVAPAPKAPAARVPAAPKASKPPVAETRPLHSGGKVTKTATPNMTSKPAAKPKPVSRPKPKPVAKAAPKPKPPAPKPVPTMQGSGYNVHYGQTLWGIARSMRSGDVSTNQMMIALKAANPDAFYKDNINNLKSGAVLRIPSHDELVATSKAEATAEVIRQDQAWQANRPSRPATRGQAGGSKAPMRAAPPSGSNATRGSRASGSGDQLRLVPPSNGGQSTGARAGVANGSDKVAVQNMRDQLSRAKEALSSSQQQTSDLKAQLTSLKSIQEKNDRLMSLKNAEIAELQNKLAEAGKPSTGASSMGPATSGSVASAASVAPAMSAGMPATAATAAAKPVVKPMAKPKPAPARVTRRAPPAEPWYAALWVKGVAGLALLVALVLLVLRGRGKKKAPAAAKKSLADQFGSSPLGDAGMGEETDAEQDELLRHLAEHPDDIESHLELVSLYYARRDVERFESAAEAMHAHVSDPQQDEWRDVMMMGEELAPDYPLFAHAGETPAEATLDHDETPSWEQDALADEPAAASATVGGDTFDFNAPQETIEAPSEDDFDALPPLSSEAPAPLAEPEEDIASFDLGDDDVDDAVEPSFESTPSFDEPDDAEPAGEAPGLGGDAVDTKIDLARAYMDMGDPDGARAMLEEAMAEGSDSQRETARKLLDELG